MPDEDTVVAHPRPDVIVITARHEEDVAADRADVLVTVQGSSLVTGRAALKKAKEVSALVEELERRGVPLEEIHLEAVHAEVSSGLLGSSSSARYRLRIRCTDLERLPEVLGAITGARNARLEQLVWRYPESAEQQARWLAAAIAWANTKALSAATALGTRLVGIHRMTEDGLEEEGRFVRMGGAPGMARARAAESVDLGFELGNQKRMGVVVTVEYRVEGFTAPASAAGA
jgi:uncharacterized protein YggE